MRCTSVVIGVAALAARTASGLARRHPSSLVRAECRNLGLGRGAARRHHEQAARIRGGFEEDDEDDEDEEDEFEEEDEDDAFEDDDEEEAFEDDEDAFEDEDDDAVSESDFAGETMQARAIKAWETTPPLTQVHVGASLALTVGCFLVNNNVWPDWLHFAVKPTFLRMQLWRPVTAFFFYGPLGISYLLTMHFVWTYMSTLEKLSHAAPWDFAIMLAFGMSLLVAGVGIAGLNPRFLAHNLSCFLVYVWARSFEGQDVSVLEFFNIKAELLPWFFAAQTYLLEHELPIHDFLGIAIGHLYCWSKQRDFITAPQWFVDLFKNQPDLMAKYEKLGEEYNDR